MENNYLTVKQFAEKHPAFSESSLRYHIFHARNNGFSKVILRVGRKILIQENVFFDWVKEQSQPTHAHSVQN